MFDNGAVWRDTAGEPIQAHGGGVLYDEGTYYWFGENKDGPTLPGARVDVVGVSCYSSRDLVAWRNEGVALPAVADDLAHELHPSQVVERPKVVRNPRTGQYVMWMHIDSPDYRKAHAGVAVSDSPAGPYRYLGSLRPDGAESRDMTLFQDEDGAAYLVFGSDWHSVVCFSRLTEDYLAPAGRFTRHLSRPGPPAGREAPAVFRRRGTYYIVTSGTTGWTPNPAEYAVAPAVTGPWSDRGSPCVGPGAETTFGAQPTFVLPVAGKPDAFILMLDRWDPQDLRDSRYVWLPLEFDGDRLVARWRDRWDLSLFG